MQTSFILDDVQKIIPLTLEDVSHNELHIDSWKMLYGKDFQKLQVTIKPYKLVVLNKHTNSNFGEPERDFQTRSILSIQYLYLHFHQPSA
jgi:hypothetical protein